MFAVDAVSDVDSVSDVQPVSDVDSVPVVEAIDAMDTGEPLRRETSADSMSTMSWLMSYAIFLLCLKVLNED